MFKTIDFGMCSFLGVQDFRTPNVKTFYVVVGNSSKLPYMAQQKRMVSFAAEACVTDRYFTKSRGNSARKQPYRPHLTSCRTGNIPFLIRLCKS